MKKSPVLIAIAIAILMTTNNGCMMYALRQAMAANRIEPVNLTEERLEELQQNSIRIKGICIFSSAGHENYKNWTNVIGKHNSIYFPVENPEIIKNILQEISEGKSAGLGLHYGIVTETYLYVQGLE